MFTNRFHCNEVATCQGKRQKKNDNNKVLHNCAICPYAKERILRELDNSKKS